MKKIEIERTEDGVKITRTSDNDLNQEQKFTLIIAILIVVGALAFFWLLVTH